MKKNGLAAILFCLSLLTLPAWGGPDNFVLPREQAARFCQLLMNDGQSIMPLSVHARRVVEPADSLTSEQIFVGFLLRDNNWQSLRLFPHRMRGGIAWFAPADALPATLDAEHQKYIHEVFTRLNSDVQLQNYDRVNQYLDKMILYQHPHFIDIHVVENHLTPRHFP